MSFKHATLFVLLALVAVQGATALRMENADERSLTDLVNKAKAAIHKLSTIVHDTIEGGLNKLGQFKNAIANIAKNVIENAKESIASEIEKIREQIKEIKEQAIAVGVDVKECVVENHDALEEVTKNTIVKLLQCVTDEVDKVKNIIESGIVEVVNIKDKIVHFPGNLKKCIVSLRPVKCIGNLIAEVVDSISSIPALITGKVHEIIQLVTNIEGTLKTCAIRKVLEASKDAAIVGAKVAKCVADKIRE